VVVHDQNGRAHALIVAEAETLRIVDGRNPGSQDSGASTGPGLLPATFRGRPTVPRFGEGRSTSPTQEE
jgi:hypothetical protein